MSNGLSAAVRTNLFSLQKIASEMTRVQTRLATGKRVNSPSEGPAAYFTASAFNARAAALDTVLDGISNGKKVIEAANLGVEAIQSLVNNARSLALEALKSPSTLAEVTGNVTGLTGATAISMDDGDTITVSDGTTTATYVHSSGNDVQDFLDAVNEWRPICIGGLRYHRRPWRWLRRWRLDCQCRVVSPPIGVRTSSKRLRFGRESRLLSPRSWIGGYRTIWLTHCLGRSHIRTSRGRGHPPRPHPDI